MAPKRLPLRPSRPAGPVAVRTPLAPVEVAFVRMVMEEHAALVRQADKHRDQRVSVLLAEKGIPASVKVTLDGDALVYLPPPEAS